MGKNIRALWDRIKMSHIPKPGLSKGREKKVKQKKYLKRRHARILQIDENTPTTDPKSLANPKEDTFKEQHMEAYLLKPESKKSLKGTKEETDIASSGKLP